MLKNMLMRDVLVEFLREEMAKNENVVVLDADLSKCSTTICLNDVYPERMLNVGIAEANMAGVAAGLSTYGFIPYITTFGPFATRRIADQLMISICYSKQNVKIVGANPGICAELNGGTHMPLEDIGMLRSIPDIVIYEPTDVIEFNQALPQIQSHYGPVYIRMHRKSPPIVHKDDLKFDLFKAMVLEKGDDVTIVASGIMVKTALDAREELAKEGISAEVICCPTIKPLDSKTILKSVKKTGAVVTAENHNVMGALTSAVSEVLVENYPAPLRSVGVKEKFGEVGKEAYLRKVFNMEVKDVVKAAKDVIKAK